MTIDVTHALHVEALPFSTAEVAASPSASTSPALQGQGVTTRPKAIAWVKMAPDILKAMSLAATHAGRTAGDIWAEAAREWLVRKALDADYDALSNQPNRRHDLALEDKQHRLWSSIDSLMGDIRQIRPTV